MDHILRFRRFVLDTAERLSWLPPTLARVAVGVVFVGTGWGKLHNLDKITAFFTDLQIPAPAFNAVLASSAELVCGALLLVGLFTRVAAIPLAITMTVAIVTARRADVGSLSDLLGFQEFLYIVLFLWLSAAGAGPLSLDRLLEGWLARGGRESRRAAVTTPQA